jgi:hypothetical protein
MRTLYLLTAALAALMVVQSALGLLFEGQYRDVVWIRATPRRSHSVECCSGVAIHRGLLEAPGQLLVWGTLAVLTTTATALLLTSVQSERA